MDANKSIKITDAGNSGTATDTLTVFASRQGEPSNIDTFECVVEVDVYSDAGDETPELPDAFSLEQNYPNPFNPTTTIRYDIPEQSDVLISLFDVLGREVKRLVDKNMKAGRLTR